jgi:hypothetical protein
MRTTSFEQWLDCNYPHELADLVDLLMAVYGLGHYYKGTVVGKSVEITGSGDDTLVLKSDKAIQYFLLYLRKLLPPQYKEFEIEEAYALQLAQNHR